MPWTPELEAELLTLLLLEKQDRDAWPPDTRPPLHEIAEAAEAEAAAKAADPEHYRAQAKRHLVARERHMRRLLQQQPCAPDGDSAGWLAARLTAWHEAAAAAEAEGSPHPDMVAPSPPEPVELAPVPDVDLMPVRTPRSSWPEPAEPPPEPPASSLRDPLRWFRGSGRSDPPLRAPDE